MCICGKSESLPKNAALVKEVKLTFQKRGRDWARRIKLT